MICSGQIVLPSLNLLSSLVTDVCIHIGDKFEEMAHHALFVGTYCSNEVDESHTLADYFDEFEASSAVFVANIHLEGMAKEG